MNIQYISDSNGTTTGVYIPINEWNKLKDKYIDIEKENIDLPEWHKNKIDKRLSEYKKDTNQLIDFDDTINSIEKEL